MHKSTVRDGNAIASAYQNKAYYAILREHGGVVDMLTTTPNSDGEYISVNATKTVVTVYAKKFSTYALVCSETVVTPSSPNPPQPGSGTQQGANASSGAQNSAASIVVSRKPVVIRHYMGNTANNDLQETDDNGIAQTQPNVTKPATEKAPSVENDETTPAENSKDNAFHIPLYVWLFIAAAAVFIVVLILRRRKEDE